MTRVIVNANASGVWAHRSGDVLEFVRAGQNAKHVIVRRQGERRTFGFPVSWLDAAEPDPALEEVSS